MFPPLDFVQFRWESAEVYTRVKPFLFLTVDDAKVLSMATF